MRLRPSPVFLAILLGLLTFQACTPAPTPSVLYHTVIRTVEVTQLVPVEVTRLVEVPVTLTPTVTPDYTATPSLTPTITPRPSRTPTWAPPKVQVLRYSPCYYGPDTDYLMKYDLNATVWMRVIGRNTDGSWLFVKAGNDPDSNGCWIQTERVQFLSGHVSDVPEYWMGLPGSKLYMPPRSVSAVRSGNVVTVFWETVWMTEDDYRGYLIEAWVCRDGKLVFEAVGAPPPMPLPPVSRNTGIFSAEIIDEPGCSQPSHARIYSVEKHGYTWFRMIPWPTHESTPTATPTRHALP